MMCWLGQWSRLSAVKAGTSVCSVHRGLADVDGAASPSDRNAEKPCAIWVEIADIRETYSTGSTLGGSTGEGAAGADLPCTCPLPAIFAWVAFDML